MCYPTPEFVTVTHIVKEFRNLFFRPFNTKKGPYRRFLPDMAPFFTSAQQTQVNSESFCCCWVNIILSYHKIWKSQALNNCGFSPRVWLRSMVVISLPCFGFAPFMWFLSIYMAPLFTLP